MTRFGVAIEQHGAVVGRSPLHGNAAAAWVFVAFIVASTAFLLFQVPFTALPAEMTALPAEQTRLMTWRTLFYTLGMLTAGVGGPLLVGGRTPAEYQRMALVVAAVLLVLLIIPVVSTRSVRSNGSGGALPLLQSLRAARENRSFFLVVTVFFLMVVLTDMTLVGLPYVAAYFLGGQAAQAGAFLAFTVASMLAVPAVGALARRRGKVPTVVGGLVLWSVAGCLAYAAAQAGTVAVAVVAGVLGVAFTGYYVPLLALLPECIRAGAERTGRDQAGAFSGLWTAFETAGHALAPLCFTVVLMLTGYASSTLDHPVTQTHTALQGILLGFSVIPSLLLLATVPVMLRYGRSTRAIPPCGPDLPKLDAGQAHI